MLEEVTKNVDVIKRLQEHFLVITRKNPNFTVLLPRTSASNDPSAVWPSVNQVAKQDHCCLCGDARSVICLDRFYHFFIQVEAPVDVADRVVTRPFRNAWGRSIRSA